jgi:hypothetical protein
MVENSTRWHETGKDVETRPWGQIPVANQPIRVLIREGARFLTSLASARSDIWLLEGFKLPRRFPQLQALRFRCTTPRKPPDPAQRNRRYYFVRLHQGSRGR